MAKYGSDEVAFFLVDGYSLLGITTELEIIKEALKEETTALGDSWQEHTPTGIKQGSINQSGFYDDDSNSVNDALSGNEGVSRVTCIGVEGNTIGQQFTGFAGAMQANYKRIASRGELHKANAEYKSNGIVEEGKIVHNHSTETGASGNTQSSSVDGTAQSADGGSGYLQVSDLVLGGYDSMTIKIQDSSDDITYSDLITFTVVSSAPAAERKTVSGTVERYIACSYEFNGAGSGQSVTFMAGFVRN